MSLIRVVICTDGIYPQSTGGMQKHSRLLIEELSRHASLQVTVIHPHAEKLFGQNVLEISVAPIDEAKIYLLECYEYSKRVYHQLKTLQVDVIYSQGLSVWYKASEFSPILIVNPHGLEPFQALGIKARLITLPIRLVFESLFKRASVVVSLGGKLTEILERKVGARTKVVEIPNAGDLPSNSPVIRSITTPIRCLFIGRIVWNKGIDILFSAIRELEKRGLLANFQFTIAGKGPLFDHFNAQNRFTNVQMIGYVSDADIPAMYNSADVLVFPTLFEGMPTAVVEAMSYGLPIIVSDVGATRVLVSNKNGRLIQPGSVKELVDALLWFSELSDQEHSGLAKESLRRFYDEFTWAAVANSHYNLFRRIKSRENTPIK